jgi:hypothetical protein
MIPKNTSIFLDNFICCIFVKAMQKRNTNSRTALLSRMIKKSYLKFPLAVMLTFTLFIQSTSGLGYIKSGFQGIASVFIKGDKPSSPIQHVFTQVPSTSTHGDINMDAEVEFSEEDELSENVHTSYHSSPQISKSEEWAYTSFLKIRHLQLAYSIQKQDQPPLFILHHSWKNRIA